jgi:hypothetical protein
MNMTVRFLEERIASPQYSRVDPAVQGRAAL